MIILITEVGKIMSAMSTMKNKYRKSVDIILPMQMGERAETLKKRTT